jgi:hypothetical protein
MSSVIPKAEERAARGLLQQPHSGLLRDVTLILPPMWDGRRTAFAIHGVPHCLIPFHLLWFGKGGPAIGIIGIIGDSHLF